MAPDRRTPPLIIIAIDGADHGLVERWAQQGFLPTIASITRRGGWTRIAERRQLCYLGSWLSLFSGRSADQHGYYDFRPLKPGTYDLELFAPRDANARPFWSCLRGRDQTIAVIDAPETHPVRGLTGIQVGNWATHQPAMSAVPAATEPPELLKDVRRVFGPRIRFAEFRPGNDIRQDHMTYRRVLKRIDRKGALCRHLLSRDRFDLIVVGFSEAHTAGHRFWGYRPELQADAAGSPDNELTDAVRTVYQRIDEQLGLLLGALPAEANVFVMSAFGMRDEYPSTGLIEAFCHRLGYQVEPDPSATSSGPLSLVRGTIPKSWRVAVSRHLPSSVQERLLAHQFRTGTDWAKTTAVAIPSLYTSFLRINLRGREPRGTVEPGAEYDALLNRIEKDLRQLVDPEEGRPAVKEVTRSVEVFGGDFPIALPDMFVEWEPTARFRRRVVHPEAELVQEEPSYLRGSYHSLQGFVAAAGPSVPPGTLTGDVSLLDLAPTFLSLLGAPIPDVMRGKPLERVYSSSVP